MAKQTLMQYIRNGLEYVPGEDEDITFQKDREYDFFMDFLGGERILRAYCFVRDAKDKLKNILYSGRD